MFDKAKTEEFIKQVMEKRPMKRPVPPPENVVDLDDKILDSVYEWYTWESRGYRRFRNKGKNNLQYFAYNYALAGVGKEKAWDYLKERYAGDVSELPELKEEFDQEYDKTAFDLKRRDWFEKL
jgi:hypothetical protein